MSINSSGAVLMEPMQQSRRYGPPTGPQAPYPRPNGSNNQCHLPPVHQTQNSSNGMWCGGSMPPQPGAMHGLHAVGSPRPGSSATSPPMLMPGCLVSRGSPISQPPHLPQQMNFPNHSPHMMAPPSISPGVSPRTLLVRPSSSQQQQQMIHRQRPPTGSGSPNVPSSDMSCFSTSAASNPVNQSRSTMRLLPMATQQQQRPPQQMQRGRRVQSVARGPQPTSVEPTRLRDGRKIKDVQRQQQQQNGGGSGGEGGEEKRAPHRFTGPGKNGMGPKQNNNNYNNDESRPIKTTVGNDESWVKGLTYSTWIDSPRGNLSDLDVKDGPHKRQGNGNGNNHRRKPQKKDSSTSSNSGGVMEMLRNLFR